MAEAAYDLVLHKDANPRTGGVAICGFSTVGMALDQIEDKRIVDATPEGLESELMKEVDGEQEIEDYSVEYEEEETEDSGITVDEDGTEWYEDEVGVWWYRDPGMEDWAEWTE